MTRITDLDVKVGGALMDELKRIRNSPRGDLAQQRFEFAVRQLDRVEVQENTSADSEALP
jgi:hypothetical protein